MSLYMHLCGGVQDTYDHVNDGMDGIHVGGPAGVCSGEVLSVVVI